MNNKILTAEFIYNNFYDQQQKADTLDGAIWEYKDDIINMMNDYAKWHVKAALEAACDNACMITEGRGFAASEVIDKSSIQEAYPLTNIK